MNTAIATLSFPYLPFKWERGSGVQEDLYIATCVGSRPELIVNGMKPTQKMKDSSVTVVVSWLNEVISCFSYRYYQFWKN